MFTIEPRIAEDRFYAWLERHWMAQQVPWAVLFFALGGWPWLVWGVAVRVTVGVTGHWLVGHFAHREGGQTWIVEGASVQGYDVALAGLVSFGESWHNNHHAYPDRLDWGWSRGKSILAGGCCWRSNAWG